MYAFISLKIHSTFIPKFFWDCSIDLNLSRVNSLSNCFFHCVIVSISFIFLFMFWNLLLQVNLNLNGFFYLFLSISFPLCLTPPCPYRFCTCLYSARGTSNLRQRFLKAFQRKEEHYGFANPASDAAESLPHILKICLFPLHL